MVWTKTIKNYWPEIILLTVSLLLYTYKLAEVPPHLNQDELAFSLNAHAIANTLRDSNGTFLPFYFWHLDQLWATPITVYLTSSFLVFLPLSESVIRLPSVAIAVLSIGLTMHVTSQFFKNRALTLFSGLIIATNPALFINGRVLLDNIFPIPFVLLWLIFLHKYLNTKKLNNILLSGLFLGIGWHSYHAAKVMFPLYFLFTIVSLFPQITKDKKLVLIFTLGASIPIIIFLPWLAKHPDTLLNQVSYIGRIDSTVNVNQGLLGVFNAKRLSLFFQNYFTYLHPKILLFEGDRSLIHSTGKIGAFLYPTILLVILGIYDTIKNQKNIISKLILLGFLAYPIAPSIVNDPQRISRGLVAIPFAVLLATYGASFLLNNKSKLSKYLLVIVVSSLAIQFSIFMRDYFGDYRARSAIWFNQNIPDTLENAIIFAQKNPVNIIYMDQNIHFGEYYFDFYEKKLDIKLNKQIIFFDTQKQKLFSENDLVITKTEPPESLNLTKIKTILEPDNTKSFFIYYSNYK